MQIFFINEFPFRIVALGDVKSRTIFVNKHGRPEYKTQGLAFGNFNGTWLAICGEQDVCPFLGSNRGVLKNSYTLPVIVEKVKDCVEYI